jgi:hypothetical protein
MSSGAQYKKRRIVNWSEYNRALVQRGSLTFWFPEEVADLWFHREPNRGRGLNKTFSDSAIQTCLMLRAVFKLPLRALQGFVDSVFALVGLRLQSPNYSVFSKRGRALEVSIPRRLPTGAVDVVVDSTGLKIFGEGEWKVRAHGAGKRRTWRKLHLAIDPNSQEILAAELTRVDIGDSEVFPGLLEQLGQTQLGIVSGDGAYDTRECYRVILDAGGRPLIPPKRGAALWEAGHPRNAAVAACREHGRKAWREASGYHVRSNAETGMYRYKQLIGPELSARLPETQMTEAYVGVAVINRMNRLGMPKRA